MAPRIKKKDDLCERVAVVEQRLDEMEKRAEEDKEERKTRQGVLDKKLDDLSKDLTEMKEYRIRQDGIDRMMGRVAKIIVGIAAFLISLKTLGIFNWLNNVTNSIKGGVK